VAEHVSSTIVEITQYLRIYRTTARIGPKALCPVHLSGKHFASKMVDYAIVLLFEEEHDQILETLRHLPEEDQNINHTSFMPVRYKPIVINIEVKVPGQGKNETMVQLSIWVAAQFNKLQALRGKLTDIGIPLISVEGHQWTIYIAHQQNDRSIVCVPLRRVDFPYLLYNGR
jgi:hypothetical protein